MAIYLKKFENHTQYDTYINGSGAILPNVSICTTEDEVHYTTAPDPYNGHDYVDLGLPSGTKWAKYNVGANSESDYGNYYQYGKGAAQYAATSGESIYSGTEDPLATSADTAAQVMGGQWHMPTQAQFNELTANTTGEWITIGGINGKKFTAQNGNYVFFPAAGNYYNGTLNNVGSNTSVFTSTLNNATSTYYLLIYSTGNVMFNGSRDEGMSVRGVVG